MKRQNVYNFTKRRCSLWKKICEERHKDVIGIFHLIIYRYAKMRRVRSVVLQSCSQTFFIEREMLSPYLNVPRDTDRT